MIPTPWREVVEAVCVEHGVTSAEVLGPCRTLKVARARHAVWAQLYPRFSSTWIGRRFNRDHTTVLHGLNRTAAAQARKRP